jgi:PAS domain S-box-containing protein
MVLSNSFLHILHECSRDEASFQRLVDLIEPQIDPSQTIATFTPDKGLVKDREIVNAQSSHDPRLSEGDLREKYDELEKFFSVALDLWCVADTDGYFIKLSKMWETTLGYPLDEMLGQRFLDFVHPDDLQATLEAIAILDAQNPILNFTNRYRCKDGSYRFIEWRSQPQGKLIYAAARDITERKHLEVDQTRLQAIIESSGEAIISRNLEGIITSWNRGAEVVYGYTAAEAIGHKMLELMRQESIPEVINNLERVKRGEYIERFENVMFRKDGVRRIISMSISPIRDQDGRIVGGSAIGQDVTERKQLEVYQAQLSAIVESSGDGIIGRTLDGIITSWNPGAEAIYGYTTNEMIGQTMEILAPDDHIHELSVNLNRVKRGDYIERYEIVRLRKDGSRINVALTISPIKAKDGTIIGISTINQDITELKQAQDALRESEARYRAIVTTMTEGVVLQGQDGSIQTCNSAAERILGLTIEQLAGRRSVDPEWRAIHEDLTPFPGETHPAMVTLQTGKPVFNVVMGVHKPDNTLTWILVNSQPVFQPGETQPYAVVASFADITQIRKMELELQQNAERLGSIVDTIEDAITSIELPSFKLVYLSPAGRQIFGRSVEDFYERPDLRTEIVHPEDAPHIQEWRTTILNTGKGNVEYRILRPDGEIRHVHSRSWLIRDAQGQPIRIEGIISDITARKFMQEQSLQLEVERERVKLLSDFISNTSHELRTPLTIIGTSVYLMAHMDNQEQRQAKAARAEQQIHYLNSLIQQLHDMVRLDHLTQLDIVPIKLSELTEQLVINYSPRNCHIVLASNSVSGLPEIMGNPDHIQLALTYLLDNANQFSPDGNEITVYTSLENNEMMIAVEDKGIGIAPEHLNRIFEHFYKVDSGRTHGEYGAGMGLAFVKLIMKRHRGRVTVESAPGEGSIFRLYFPLLNAAN